MITTVLVNIEKHLIEITLPTSGPKGFSHQPLDRGQPSTFTK
jgi:hypothetical protein